MYAHIPISNKDVWQATLDQWKKDTFALGDEGVFISLDIERRLDGLKHQTESIDNLHCYFLVKKDTLVASSILEVTHAMPKSDDPWLKLLNITFRPIFLPQDTKPTEIIKETIEVLIFSIVHVIELIFHEHPSTKLKIFARTPEMNNFFQMIVGLDKLETALDPLQLSIRLEGRWLVLVKNNQKSTQEELT
jgi:hypothetical protein